MEAAAPLLSLPPTAGGLAGRAERAKEVSEEEEEEANEEEEEEEEEEGRDLLSSIGMPRQTDHSEGVMRESWSKSQ